MLQEINEHIKGWIAALIMGIVGLTFVLWGVQYYIDADHKEGRVLAKVGRQKITEQQVDFLSRQLQRQVAAKGTIVDETVQQTLRQVALQNVIIEKALTAAAYRDGFRFDLQQAKQVAMQLPIFQDHGQFSIEKFNRFLYASDLNETQFLNALQNEFLIGVLRNGISGSAFVLPDQFKTNYELLHQQRSFSYLTVPAHRFDASVKVSAAQMENYYANNKERFRSPERISIEYVQLSSSNSAKAEQLENLAFTNPDSLEPIVSALQLTIQHSDFFDRQGAHQGIASEPAIITAAFSPSVLQGNNSDPIILKEGTMVILRIKQHKPSMIMPLKAVQSAVHAQVVSQLAQAKAVLFANQLEEKVRSGASIEKIATTHQLVWTTKTHLERTDTKAVSPSILDAAFRLSLSSPITTVALESGDTAIIRLEKIDSPSIDHITAKEKQLFETALRQWMGQLTYALYLADIKAKTTIKVF